MNDDQTDACFNTGDMLCRHPYGKCRYMVGRVKPFTVSIRYRKCGIAYPDNECKPISRKEMENLEKAVKISELALATQGY